MASLSTTVVQNLTDNIAKQIMDFNTSFVVNPANNAPTIPTLLGGLSSLTVSTTSTTSVTAPGAVAITPTSLQNIYAGTQLTTSGGVTTSGGATAATVETVTVLSVNAAAGTFTAIFAYTHYGTTTYTQTAGNSLTNRVAALTDFAQSSVLEPAAARSVAAVGTYIAMDQQMTNLYAGFAYICDAIDTQVGGLNAFLTTNTITVNRRFAECFNYYVTVAQALGLRSSGNAPAAIVAANTFIEANLVMASIAVTGAAAGTYTQGVQAPTVMGTPLLYVWKTTGTGAAQTVFNVSYVNSSGTIVSGSVTLAAAQGTTPASIALSGSMITGITVTSLGTNAETYNFGLGSVTRVAAY